MTRQASDVMWIEGGYQSCIGDEDIPAQSPDVLGTDCNTPPGMCGRKGGEGEARFRLVTPYVYFC